MENQTTDEVFEVIVVDSSQDGTEQLIARGFPQVRLFHVSHRLFPGDARNLGAAQAAGDIIAFTDADCVVENNWIETIVRLHQQTPHPILGGIIDNGNPESFVGWTYYFCSFSQWMPPAALRTMDEIPTSCLTLKRWALLKYGPFLEGTFCSDSALNWKLASHGYKPWLVPSLKVWHTNYTDLGAILRRKIFHGKCFGQVRSQEHRFPLPKRVLYAAGTPLLPFLLFSRLVFRVAGNQRYVKQFLFSSPLIWLVLAAWSWGELLGYLSSLNQKQEKP